MCRPLARWRLWHLHRSIIGDRRPVYHRSLPGGVPVWARAVAQRLSAQSGISVPVYNEQRIRIVSEDDGTAHARWLLARTMDVFGLDASPNRLRRKRIW